MSVRTPARPGAPPPRAVAVEPVRAAPEASAEQQHERQPAPAATSLPLWLALGKAWAAIACCLLVCFLAVVAIAGAGAASMGGCETVTVAGEGIPATLVPIYERAAARFGLGARGAAVLAAINRIETDFGRDMSTSSAGAVGFMQFMPQTWAVYAVDGDGDGRKDPRDPWDAIFTAARYLRASGAPGDWQAAVFAYNHAAWYVQDVLAHAARYTVAGPGAGACGVAPAGGTLARMIAEANRIAALRVPYVYGGGHVTPAPANGPWDCSSAWSRLLQASGFRIPTMTSSGFMTWGDPGPGRYVTIYATPAHVDGTIEGRAWGTGGSNGRNPGGGPAWLPYAVNPVPGFPGGTPTVRHPPGL